MEKLQKRGLTQSQVKLSEEKTYSLFLINDDTTPVDFVECMLNSCMYFSAKEIEKIIRLTEKNDECELKEFSSYEIAEWVKAQCEDFVNNENEKYGIPRRFRMKVERTV